jgi:hypothetical protein
MLLLSLTGFKVLQQLRESQSRTLPVMLLDVAERELVIDAFRRGPGCLHPGGFVQRSSQMYLRRA